MMSAATTLCPTRTIRRPSLSKNCTAAAQAVLNEGAFLTYREEVSKQILSKQCRKRAAHFDSNAGDRCTQEKKMSLCFAHLLSCDPVDSSTKRGPLRKVGIGLD